MHEGTVQHRGPSDARQKALCLLTDQCASLYIGLSPMIGGDGLFSFNLKLAVLVSEPDVQIKKVRHAHLILVNLPLHISPACQLLCDSNHHRHMPLLCAPLWVSPTHPPALAVHSCSFPSSTDIYVSLSSHYQKWNSVNFPKNHGCSTDTQRGNLICLSTYSKMLNMAANDQLWTWGQRGHRGLWMSTSEEQQLSWPQWNLHGDGKRSMRRSST